METERSFSTSNMMTIEKKYIVVPINNHAVSKKLCFYEDAGDGKRLVMDFDCKMDFLHPQYMVYIDVSRYMGRKFSYDSIPHMEFTLKQSDSKELDGLYQEEYRPLSHFTPQIGWINDPNGMIKYQGTYHMFYQYNPCGTEWGNMHWGHAVSQDLLHWAEKDIALFPDEMGTMYSGSAIEDTHNVTGLQTTDKPPMLLFYTAAGDRTLLAAGKLRTQCLAVSHDGGRTFEKYAKNPILDSVVNYNRDPKVVYVEEIQKYLMVLYLAEDRYGLFVSDNMLDWMPLQEIRIANESECPDIYRCKVGSKTYWVLIGASDQYIVGIFRDGKFVPQTQEKQLCYSPYSYAAQSFSGIENGRIIRMAWQKLKMPCLRVPNQMSVPMEMKLKVSDMGCFLTAYPVEEIKQLYLDTKVITNIPLDAPIEIKLDQAAYDMHIVADYDSKMNLDLFGHTLQINTQDNCITFGKLKMPLSSDQATVDIRIIVDRCSFEVFADEGRFYAALYAVCDYNLPYLKLSAESSGKVRSLSCHKLAPIHG